MGPLSRYEIIQVYPCGVDPTKIRFVAEYDADLRDVLPYLNATVARASYNPMSKSLTVLDEGRRLTFCGRRVSGTRVDNVADAVTRIERWMTTINETWARRASIQPSEARGAVLTAIELQRFLPGTDCGECGHRTCRELAIELYDERVSIMLCRPLFTPPWKDRRRTLLERLEAAGHEVPEDLLGGG